MSRSLRSLANNTSTTTLYQPTLPQNYISHIISKTLHQEHYINNTASITTLHQQHYINNTASITTIHREHCINNVTLHQQYCIINTETTLYHKQHCINNTTSIINNTASTTTLQQYINKQEYPSGMWWVGKSTQYTRTLTDAGSDWQAWH